MPYRCDDTVAETGEYEDASGGLTPSAGQRKGAARNASVTPVHSSGGVTVLPAADAPGEERSFPGGFFDRSSLDEPQNVIVTPASNDRPGAGSGKKGVEGYEFAQIRSLKSMPPNGL